MESKYEIAVSWSEEDGAYIATVPDLPGCMADGRTRAEAVANAEQAIQAWGETAKEMGRAMPCDPPKILKKIDNALWFFGKFLQTI